MFVQVLMYEEFISDTALFNQEHKYKHQNFVILIVHIYLSYLSIPSLLDGGLPRHLAPIDYNWTHLFIDYDIWAINICPNAQNFSLHQVQLRFDRKSTILEHILSTMQRLEEKMSSIEEALRGASKHEAESE